MSTSARSRWAGLLASSRRVLPGRVRGRFGGARHTAVRAARPARTVVVATEARLFLSSEGAVLAATEGRAYGFWSRYLDAFSDVVVLARVSDREAARGAEVVGPGVRVAPVTDYLGPVGLARALRAVRRDVRTALARDPDAAVIARVPGFLGSQLVSVARRSGKPYALEVVGDPRQSLTATSLPAPLARAVAVAEALRMGRLVKRADLVSYVTASQLQEAYPASRRATVATYSSVDLPPEAFNDRIPRSTPAPHLIVVGNLERTYKGHHVLLDALACDELQHVRLTVVGEGTLKARLRQQAVENGQADRVEFTGHVAEAVRIRSLLDEADLFVLPSLTEGLPRALIEAMARSLPCVGTDVGGVPELLERSELVQPGDVHGLARRIAEILAAPTRMERLARDNFDKANAYSSDRLREVRGSYYRHVAAATGTWNSASEEF